MAQGYSEPRDEVATASVYLGNRGARQSYRYQRIPELDACRYALHM